MGAGCLHESLFVHGFLQLNVVNLPKLLRLTQQNCIVNSRLDVTRQKQPIDSLGPKTSFMHNSQFVLKTILLKIEFQFRVHARVTTSVSSDVDW